MPTIVGSADGGYPTGTIEAMIEISPLTMEGRIVAPIQNVVDAAVCGPARAVVSAMVYVPVINAVNATSGVVRDVTFDIVFLDW